MRDEAGNWNKEEGAAPSSLPANGVKFRIRSEVNVVECLY